jgi:hypothetical protein
VAVVVTTKVAKQGSSLSGNVSEILIVKPDSGYGPSPGQAGEGTIVATLCSD